MANYASLLANIATNIYTNNNNEVTAEMVKSALTSMVNSLGYGYQFRGEVEAGDNGPGAIDQKVCYLATTPGVYHGFGHFLVGTNEVALLKWDTEWHKEILDIPSKSQIMAILSAQDNEIAAQDANIEAFKAAVQNMVENYPNITIVGDVTNAPDEEDITTDANNLLKFANRPAVNGKGYIIIRRGASLASQMTEANTIYEIRYNFDLAGGSLTIPSGAVLRFIGGCIKNGTIVSDGDFSIESPVKCLDSITFSGKCRGNFIPKLVWFVSEYPEDTNDTSVDNTAEVRQCMNCGCKSVMFPTDKFIHLTDTITMTKAVSIVTEDVTRITSETYSLPDVYEAYVLPCVFSHEVVTLFDFTLNVFDAEVPYHYPFSIGQIRLYVDKFFDEISGSSVNTPIVKIVSGVIDNENNGNTQWGVTLDCEIRAKQYLLNLAPEEQIPDGGDQDAAVNYTGILLRSDGAAMSMVTINGDIYGTHFGVVAEQTNSWFTDVIINGKTWCDFGAKVANVQPLIITNTHQCHPIPTGYNSQHGYFYGSDSVRLFGKVWDMGARSPRSTWTNAESDVYSTGGAEGVFRTMNESYRENRAMLAYPNPCDILERVTGNTALMNFPNLLYQTFRSTSIVKELSYKLQFTDEVALTESLGTSRIINGDILFNDGLLTKMTANKLNLFKVARGEKNIAALQASFKIVGTGFMAGTVGANQPYYLIVGAYLPGSTNVQTYNVLIEGSDDDNTYTQCISDTFNASFYPLSLKKYNLAMFSYTYFRITITGTISSGTQRILPIIRIPAYAALDENNAFASSARPTLDGTNRTGVRIFDKTLGKDLNWDGANYRESDGAMAGVRRSGTFANKPAASDIYVGFAYFCTDKQTTEGATNGIPIYHKGSDVWVDAMGRTIS